MKTELTEEEAYVYVIETNVLQRSFSELKPSEQAAVMAEHYEKMCGSLRHDEIVKELEALTGKKDSRCGGHNGHRAKSRDLMAAEYGFSSRTAARMLRLNYLIPEFKRLVDEGNVALLAAVDMSFLEEGEQQAIWKLLNRQGLKLKPKAAAELRKHGGELTEEKIVEILDALSINKRSGNEGLNLKLPNSLCEKYFSGMESNEMASIVEQALEAWFAGKGAAYVQS